MTMCPRCGTCLLPAATVCTGCCHSLDDTTRDDTYSLVDVAPPAIGNDASSTEDNDNRVAMDTLTSWPFGGVDEETFRAVAETEAANAVALDSAPPVSTREIAGNGLGIPTQRAAYFNPLTVSKTPPPNPYIAAERRQQASYRVSAQADAEKSGRSEPTI